MELNRIRTLKKTKNGSGRQEKPNPDPTPEKQPGFCLISPSAFFNTDIGSERVCPDQYHRNRGLDTDAISP